MHSNVSPITTTTPPPPPSTPTPSTPTPTSLPSRTTTPWSFISIRPEDPLAAKLAITVSLLTVPGSFILFTLYPYVPLKLSIPIACSVLIIGLIIFLSIRFNIFLRLLDVDPGFRPEQTASWRIEPGGRYQTPAQLDTLYDRIVRSVESIQGVESVGLTDCLPLGRNRTWGVRAKGETYTPETYPNAFPRMI